MASVGDLPLILRAKALWHLTMNPLKQDWWYSLLSDTSQEWFKYLSKVVSFLACIKHAKFGDVWYVSFYGRIRYAYT